MAYCNISIELFEGEGKYNIPKLKPVYDLPIHKWARFSEVLQNRKEKHDTGVHFFIEDYFFERVWNHPNKYIIPLSRFGCVLSPDFSMFTDMPRALQIYNHYRKHWVAAYWQQQNFTVIPTIGWVDEESFEWCFDGEPTESIVAVNNVGADKELFKAGYDEMIRRLNPKEILFYSRSFNPKLFDGNIRRIMYSHGYTSEVPNDLGLW